MDQSDGPASQTPRSVHSKASDDRPPVAAEHDVINQESITITTDGQTSTEIQSEDTDPKADTNSTPEDLDRQSSTTIQPPVMDPSDVMVTTQPPVSDPHVTIVTTQPPISDPHVTMVTTQPPLSDQQSPVPDTAVTSGQGEEKKSDTFLQRMKNADTMGEKFNEVKTSMTHGAQKIGGMIDEKIRSLNAHKDPQMTMVPAEGTPVAQTTCFMPPAVVQAQTLQSSTVTQPQVEYTQSPIETQPQPAYAQSPMETKNQAATMATSPQYMHPQGPAVVQPQAINPQVMAAPYNQVQPQTINPQVMAAPYNQFQNQGSGVVIVSGSLGDQPSVTVCPNCGKRVMTRVVFKSGPFSWVMCSTCIIFGLVFGCCVIPFFMDYFKDAHHFCPECGNPLHVHKRM
ncbi:uncharacterized protein LOC143121339 isoform X1 [Alosa pseudoharengus]|uniref:uncharacterized protein LOC143121339 isoform X1 n=1 Tax=Alosa pseudoharengus TaxID=34774 RepID=UPI003F8ABB67